MENPVNTDYMKRAFTVDKKIIKSEGSDEDEDEDDEGKQRLNRNKVPLYKKPFKDIRKFPFMAGKKGDDESDYEDHDDKQESRGRSPAANRRGSPNQRPANDDFGGDFGDMGGFGDDF